MEIQCNGIAPLKKFLDRGDSLFRYRINWLFPLIPVSRKNLARDKNNLRTAIKKKSI